MAISPEDILPANNAPVAPPAAPAAPTTPEPEAKGKKGESLIPEEVLQFPVVRALLQGAPPAVFSPTGDKSPEAAVIGKNYKKLLEAGFGFYRAKDGTVMFNNMFVSPAEIKLADEQGRLGDFAPPLSELNQTFDQFDQGGAAAAPGAAPAPVAGAAGQPMAPPTPSVTNRLTSARAKNATPGSPTSGPNPGAGRILNNILKSAV